MGFVFQWLRSHATACHVSSPMHATPDSWEHMCRKIYMSRLIYEPPTQAPKQQKAQNTENTLSPEPSRYRLRILMLQQSPHHPAFLLACSRSCLVACSNSSSSVRAHVPSEALHYSGSLEGKRGSPRTCTGHQTMELRAAQSVV